jgi:hypothetical protein
VETINAPIDESNSFREHGPGKPAQKLRLPWVSKCSVFFIGQGLTTPDSSKSHLSHSLHTRYFVMKTPKLIRMSQTPLPKPQALVGKPSSLSPFWGLCHEAGRWANGRASISQVGGLSENAVKQTCSIVLFRSLANSSTCLSVVDEPGLTIATKEFGQDQI